MLIVNDDQLRLAGIVSLEERCTYCSKTLAAFPLVMSDDVDPSSAILESVVPWGWWLPKAGRKGQLRVMIRGWSRWYPVESVRIERTGQGLLQEGLTWFPPAGVLAWAPTGPARGAAE